MKTFCAYYNQDVCRSCDLITFDYNNQISIKEEALRKALGEIPAPAFLDSVRSAPTHFRNKAKFVVTGTVDNPVIGLWGEDELDEGRELLDCPLHLKEINKTLHSIKEFIQLAKLVPYNIRSRKGELKGIILFYSNVSQEMYLRFVMRSQEPITRLIKHKDFFLKQPELKVISVNIQPIPHAHLEGDEEIFITERKSLNHELKVVSMNLDPRAFVQTNQNVAEKLYETAASWVKELNIKNFLELYCGQGAFSFFAASSIQKGLGIEINPSAVVEANLTAAKRKLDHLNFKCANASEVELEIKNFAPSLILVNPPRRGLAETVHLLISEKPEYIIYSSCSYETLADDLKTLTKHYDIKKTQVFDMFPHTKHFETLVLLSRKTILAD